MPLPVRLRCVKRNKGIAGIHQTGPVVLNCDDQFAASRSKTRQSAHQTLDFRTIGIRASSADSEGQLRPHFAAD